MASIKVSIPDIFTAIHGLDSARPVAQRIAHRSALRRGALHGCGHRRLAQSSDEMLAAWERALGELVEDAADLSSLLRDAARAYGHTERSVVASASSVCEAPAR